MSQVLWREESDMQLMQARETTIDSPHSLAHLMGQTNTAIWRFITRKTHAMGGITGMQASVLLLLTGRRSTRLIDLAREYNLCTSVVTRLVDRLVRTGLVERVPSERDRRVIYLQTTRAGKKTASRLPSIFAHAFETLLDGMEERDVDTLRRSLRHIFVNARGADKLSGSSIHQDFDNY
jgi:DNA-binding MarR family transcriptional regulator